ncbi:TPA: Clp protease ClpP [Corynebacterium striatum]|uniref:head maturation protease, ClpP-related n=1 Tax=Corynebacterium striatum TaxID=43770 RepID=UPI003F7DECA0|nr:Clp protease ClpP [Corynebacterium striatum]
MSVDVYLYEDIEQGLASRIVGELRAADGADILLHVNSYGGDVFEGKTIMQALRNHGGKVTARVEGIAASAASFITVGGADRIVMCEGSRMMVHNALSMAFGNANELDRLSEQLRGQSQDIAEIYAERSGKPVDEWLAAMDEETWFTAEQAVTAGLADAVEESRVTNSALCPVSRVANLFKNQAQAPPKSLLEPVSRSESGNEKTTTPLDGRKGDAMSIQNLAQELGVEPDELRKKLSGFFNETVQVNTEVEISYPEDTQVVPTGKATITPVGDVPTGLSFALGEVAEGWAAEVAEETGVITVTAPNSEPGEQVALTVTVQSGEGEPTELTTGVTVKAAADDEAEPTSAEPAAPGTPGELGGDTVSLDRETYAELKAAAQFGWKSMEKDKESKLVAEVDGWVKDGRISASLRAKAVAAMKRDPQTARDLYGSNPKGTIPRAEIGYGVDDTADGENPNTISDERKAAIVRALNLNH